MYIFQFYRKGGERSHANTRLINPALYEKIFRRLSTTLLSPILTTSASMVISVDGDNATNKREKKKISTLSSHRIFLPFLPLNGCEPSITPERKAGERIGEREKRDERRLNGRSQNYWIERGKSGAIRARLTANAERIYPSLSSFPSLYPRVSSSSPFPRQISSVTPPLLPPPPLLSTLCSSEIIATPPIVSRWYTGLAQAQTRYLSVIRKASRSIKDVL